MTARWLILAALTVGCSEPIDAGGALVDAGAPDDPLVVAEPPAPGSLDDIYQNILVARCSGQPGLCHNGQFEPNLSTPALAYAYLVGRPGIEKPGKLRVAPGSPEDSLLIDKLRNRDVATQMPLGAEPLTEEEIVLIENWIEDGALRRPGAEAAPDLNNPPATPEIAIFDAAGNRLDSSGQVTVPPGTFLTFRHTVDDFETADADIAITVMVLQAPDGRQVVLSPGAQDPEVALTTYDPDGPAAVGDTFNYELDFQLGDTITLIDPDTGVTEDVASAGLSLSAIALYIDELPGGISRFSIRPNALVVQ